MEAQYIVDAEGNRKSVVLPIEEYEALLEAREELEDAHDHERVMADVRSGKEPRTLRQSLGE